ncbi:hypothetical protein KIJ96_06025 [Pseudoalteromonas piscicida]|uniref:PssE/Cps14G family polysaccharide biosynthesis glycosyltransferase n=1 Tax=Pseudoalteromonas piscicida TaxID=43662 RepID=UPI001D0BA262|nr:PssE/Cps14G family polysaccharide biosynthesis glycosyltransferase [Pseudoalteromonas piscicida]UDM62796.1 hypothetical protein KIJ96_06025 [Pseudoalteromonas piscicida]
MKILVTVGSSSFDTLVKAVDEAAQTFPQHHFTFQIGKGDFQPRNGEYFGFSNHFSNTLKDADLIITHAGAGTVFELLEIGKKCIIVPNFGRVDKHQSDLADYVDKHNYAIVCTQIDSIAQLINGASNYQPSAYVKEPFFLAEDLVRLFSQP